MTNNLIVIVGPTAIGKTKLSLELAKYFKTEILSADSRQFYKEMNVGTAVPSCEELGQVPHHFIQHLSVHTAYSVGNFEKDALQLLDKKFEQQNPLVMVGGSGLYVDAVTKGLNQFPDVPQDVKNEINLLFQEKGVEALQNKIKKLDPVSYAKIDLQNPHRLIRVLSVCKASGKPYSSFISNKPMNRKFSTLWIGIEAQREVVYKRIEQRVDVMFENGLLDEAKKLYPFKNLNALNTVGYKELFSYFDGNLSLEEAKNEIKKNTRRFAKRQLTWFSKNKNINWFDYQTPSAKIIDFLLNN